MATINIDTAWVLNIQGVYEGNSFDFTLNRFADEGQTIEEDWPDVPYTLAIALDAQGTTPQLMLLTRDNSEIIISGNELTIRCTADQNLMTSLNNKPKNYYYDLVQDLGEGLTKVEGKGTITCNPSVAR